MRLSWLWRWVDISVSIKCVWSSVCALSSIMSAITFRYLIVQWLFHQSFYFSNKLNSHVFQKGRKWEPKRAGRRILFYCCSFFLSMFFFFILFVLCSAAFILFFGVPVAFSRLQSMSKLVLTRPIGVSECCNRARKKREAKIHIHKMCSSIESERTINKGRTCVWYEMSQLSSYNENYLWNIWMGWKRAITVV